MNNYSAKDLFQILNQQDECDWIEAKGGSESSHSVMETVCAYANEPGLGGGYILLGVAEDNSSLFPLYKLVNIADPDKLQKDFVSQCSSMFNMPLRPKLDVEKVDGNTIIKIKVDELAQTQKPLYFKTEGLPFGAYRRVGPTDQRCTEDDMHIFYSDYKSYDQTGIEGSSIANIDENALNRYRALREKVNPTAEELTYNDQELLESLGCVSKKNKIELTLAGLLLFGSSKALRSYYPMLRVDYVRVPGNEWVQNPDDRFTTIDMRGPLLILLYRLMDAINGDLPKGFLLGEDEIQASSVGLPAKALREAIVNALMHRSYREHRPTQVVRYDNRIEIINPGYSLKAEEKLGEPGSETRNPFIAAVFHETNLAETKGSGIRAMRKLMQNSHLVPPTFDSDRQNNQFTSRLLLHHFLDEKDLQWLSRFDEHHLKDGQKQALIFVREVGAIDNTTYRQMSNCDVIQASIELRQLKNLELFKSKGKGKGTYYIPGDNLGAPDDELITGTNDLRAGVKAVITHAKDLSTHAQGLSTHGKSKKTTESEIRTHDAIPLVITEALQQKINALKIRVRDKSQIEEIILELCSQRPVKARELSQILDKGEHYIKRNFLSKMIEKGKLNYFYPEMIKHPQQAYKTKS